MKYFKIDYKRSPLLLIDFTLKKVSFIDKHGHKQPNEVLAGSQTRKYTHCGFENPQAQ
jgi:hypothetical protein